MSEYILDRKRHPMTTRRLALAGLALAGLASPFFARSALANAVRPFTVDAFKAAQAADRMILVDVTASWCPTCRVQKPILARLLAQPRFAQMQAFEIDFDRQKDFMRIVDARQQSTLVVYRGADEMGRSMGDTNAASIESLLSMAL
jgi:thioredoxin 1